MSWNSSSMRWKKTDSNWAQIEMKNEALKDYSFAAQTVPTPNTGS